MIYIFSEAYLFYSSSRFEQTPLDAWILTIRINTTIIIIIIIIIIGIIIIIIAIILIRAMFITKVLTDWWRGGLHEGCKSNSPGDPLVILNHVHHTNHNYHDNDFLKTTIVLLFCLLHLFGCLLWFFLVCLLFVVYVVCVGWVALMML